ncbi:MAG TPA: hypothetical protein VIC25_04320 [Caulobacteraceae bacterium]
MGGLAVLALALTVLVPPGFMVGGGDTGEVRLVICTGHGAITSALDLGGHGAPRRNAPSHGPCIFAGHGAPARIVAPTPLRAIVWTPAAAPIGARPVQVRIGHGLAAPPPARGPPAAFN